MVSCCILIGYGRMGLLEGAVMNWPGFHGIQARGKFQHDNREKKTENYHTKNGRTYMFQTIIVCTHVSF